MTEEEIGKKQLKDITSADIMMNMGIREGIIMAGQFMVTYDGPSQGVVDFFNSKIKEIDDFLEIIGNNLDKLDLEK